MVSIGSNSRANIQVVNDGAAPMPVEVLLKKLEIAEDGRTTESPASDDFLVFPPQAVVPAGATQSFRIQWVGALGWTVAVCHRDGNIVALRLLDRRTRL